MRIFAWYQYLEKLLLVGAIRSFIFNFFANQNLSRHRKAEPLGKWIALVLQVKFRYTGCLVKANALQYQRKQIASSLSSQLIVLVFMKQPSTERYLTFRKFQQHIKIRFVKFQKVHKKHPWRSLILVKLQAFTGATTGCILFLEKCSQNSQEKVCVRGCKKETLAQVFSCEFSKISKNTFFTEHRPDDCLCFQLFRSSHRRCSMKKGVLENFAKFTGKHLWFAKFSKTPFLQNTSGRLLLAFSCNVTKMGYCQQYLEKLR